MALNSFNKCPGTTSPKVNLTFGSPRARYLPQFGLSFAKAFHANDPRTGNGAGRGQLIAATCEFQLLATEFFGSVQARLTLGQVRSSSEFAKIDPDTGLQANVGPVRTGF